MNSSAVRRLMSDFKELQAKPFRTVAAAPVDDDIFTWHVNLMAPEGSVYEGGIYHGEMKFPTDYPLRGPTLNLFTDIPHPHVFGGRICLSILNNEFTDHFGDIRGESWSSSYTVSTILLQLQTFLLDESSDDAGGKDYYRRMDASLKSAKRHAELFMCSTCGHKQKKPWPPVAFFTDNKKKKKEQKYKESELQLIMSELICYHTRLSFEESILGIGLQVDRRGRQCNITSTLDILSYDAWKDGIRTNPTGVEVFTHWLPLYINEEHGKKALRLAMKTITEISLNKTNPYKDNEEIPFKPEMVLKVLPPLMNTMVVDLMKGERYLSLRALEGYCTFHRLFLMFISAFPELLVKVNEMVDSFTEKEKNRRKDSCTSLGEWITLLSVSKKTWRDPDVVRAYLSENFDRNAFWVIKQFPSLALEKPDEKVDAARVRYTFEATIVSCRLLMFHVYFLDKIARPLGKTLDEISIDYDKLLGRPSLLAREELQTTCKQILEKAQTFQDFFSGINFPVPTEEKLCEALRLAIWHSRKKGYHSSAKKFQVEKPEPSALKPQGNLETEETRRIAKEKKIELLKKEILETEQKLENLKIQLYELTRSW